MKLTNMSEIKPLLERHGFGFSKSLGQNFLINAEIPKKIANAAQLTQNSAVIEIGPGIGCLTQELALRAKKVVAVEIDKKLLPILSETLIEFSNILVVNEDIMETDINAIIKKEELEDVSVCANLPYYITSPVIMKLLESKLPIKNITVMIQKEVAKRFAAKPGSKDFGAITLALNYFADIKYLFDVSANNFYPKPNVESAVIQLTLIPPPVNVNDEKLFFRIIKAAFAMRRKTLENNLINEFSISREKAAFILKELGFNEKIRGESLNLNDFARLENKFFEEQIN